MFDMSLSAKLFALVVVMSVAFGVVLRVEMKENARLKQEVSQLKLTMQLETHVAGILSEINQKQLFSRVEVNAVLRQASAAVKAATVRLNEAQGILEEHGLLREIRSTGIERAIIEAGEEQQYEIREPMEPDQNPGLLEYNNRYADRQRLLTNAVTTGNTLITDTY